MNFIKKLLKPKQSTIQTTLIITSSNGFHLRPIAKFVNEVKKFEETITIAVNSQEVSATQVPKILSLALEQGDSFVLKIDGEGARKASKYLSSYFHKLMQEDTKVEIAKQEDENYQSVTLSGDTIAKGVGIAPLTRYKSIEMIDESNSLSIEEAIRLTKDELLKFYEKNKLDSNSQIFLAQKELLSSEIFEQEFRDIEDFKRVINSEIKKLQNTKFQSRVSDYRDLEQRVLSHLGIKHLLKLPSIPYILLADDLLPSEVERISKTPVQGVLLQKGTLTSHASILLRSFGIASIIIDKEICKDRCSYPNAILDANSGDLILEPTSRDIRKAEKKQKVFNAKQKYSFNNRFNPTETKFGRKIRVLANITDINSAKEAKEQGADGIGLLRTEFLFTDTKPTLEEQIESYREIFELFDDITIRTLDIGGDKSLPYINIAKEDNPFLGLRGIRFSLYEQTLFREQLLAIFKASNGKPVKIMFPMISEKDEFREAKKIAKEVAKESSIDISHIMFGIMIEVPSVILALKVFDKGVDFFSIGTNDLTQYLFAIERTHPILHINLVSPIVMSALKIIIDNTTKPISICGELAGIEDVTKQLINMGYNNLSVSSKLIPSLKERIRLI
jgi:phosphocarrier protein FPr